MPKTAADQFAHALAVTGGEDICGIAGDGLNGRGAALVDVARTTLWR